MGLCREGQTRSAGMRSRYLLQYTLYGYLRRPRRCWYSLKFLLPRRAYMRNKPWIGSPVVFVIATSFAEAQVAIDCSADHVGIAVILPIILPPADLAKLQRFRHSQGSIPAAKAAGRSRRSHGVSMRRMVSAPKSEAWLPLRRDFLPDYYGNGVLLPRRNNSSRTFQVTDCPGRSVTMPVSIPFHCFPNGST